MKAIIILGFSVLAQTVFSQQQQQVQSRNIVITNISNVNFLNNRAVLSNVQVNVNNNEQKQQVVRSTTRVTPSRRYTQVRATNANATTQVRRRVRPRPVNTTPQVVSQPQVLNNNSFDANEMLNASNINAPAQNFILPVNVDVQTQNFSNVAKEGSNPFSQQETNKVNLDINVDLSLNLKGKTITRTRSSASSSSGSSSHSRSHAFSKKMAKFKRNFFGKLSSHKKGNHRLDMCFNWKS